MPFDGDEIGAEAQKAISLAEDGPAAIRSTSWLLTRRTTRLTGLCFQARRRYRRAIMDRRANGGKGITGEMSKCSEEFRVAQRKSPTARWHGFRVRRSFQSVTAVRLDNSYISG